jgi:DNA repair photolyase
MNFSENSDNIRMHLISFSDTIEYYRSLDPLTPIGVIADGYIKNQIDMENGMREYYEYLNEENRRNLRLLKAIKAVKGKTFYKHILEVIEQSEGLKGQAEIVKEPVGKFQKENYGREIKGIWIQQWGVGDSGDSWEGIVCVKIKENKYLKFAYSM